MNRRNAVILGIVLLWLVILPLLTKTAIDRLVTPIWGNPAADRHSPGVAGDTSVGQQFVAPLPGLYRIEIALARATAHSSNRITIHLKDDPATGQDLWTVSLDAREVQDGTPYGFEFEPIRDSKGRTYYFYLESAGSVPGDAIAVYYSPYATLEGAGAYLNHQPIAGNLQFHTFYSLRTRDKIDLLLTRMSEDRPYVLGTKGFYLGLLGAYAFVFGIFLCLVVRAASATPKGTA